MSGKPWTKAHDQGEKDFYGYSKENPKFTGDILFHIGLRNIINTCHEARFSRPISDYYESIFGFFAEIKHWMDNDKAKEIEAKLENVASNIMILMRQGSDELILFDTKQNLNKIFLELNDQAHANNLILAKADTSSGSILDRV